MSTLKFLLQKEFLQIFRNTLILRVMFVAPMLQLLVLPLAADFEVKNISLSIIDHDHSTYSERLRQKFTAGGYFKLTDVSPSFKQALNSIERDRADLIIEIPQGFERNLTRENQTTVFIAANAINGVKGGLGGAYAANIIREFNQEIRAEWVAQPRMGLMPSLDLSYTYWYNRDMSYQIYIVPGLLVMLLTMVGANLASSNIVREKEIGTIEQINVTPIPKAIFILGKLIPFWILGMFVFTMGLVLARLVYGIAPLGSLWTLYGFAALYLVGVLGFGLFISTVSDTQQQSLFISFFFMMIFILMSGLYTPIQSMPTWAQWLTYTINPLSHFISAIRLMVLKGSSFVDLLPQFGAILAFSIVTNGLAVWNYRKTS